MKGRGQTEAQLKYAAEQYLNLDREKIGKKLEELYKKRIIEGWNEFEPAEDADEVFKLIRGCDGE